MEGSACAVTFKAPPVYGRQIERWQRREVMTKDELLVFVLRGSEDWSEISCLRPGPVRAPGVMSRKDRRTVTVDYVGFAPT